jgi:hypothetical protein
MVRRLLACLAGTLAAAPAALAAGPSPGVAQGGLGVAAPGGGVRYVALGGREGTTVEAVRTRDGRVVRFATYAGSLGVPLVGFDGTAGGLSGDGSTLVLADMSTGDESSPLKKRSWFAVLNAKNLRLREQVELRGDFTFDALSPDGSRLYLIQHVSAQNLTRYVVRAYDLGQRRLLPDWIADKTQRGWVMRGMPVTRATGPGGRWAYTLYMNPEGYPFVHALDTVSGTAHCIGIPWTGKQDALWKLRLSLRDGGRTLSLHWRSGKEYLAVTKGTWRITHPAPVHAAAAGFPWWIFGVAGGALLVAAAFFLRRRLGYGLRARAATN